MSDARDLTEKIHHGDPVLVACVVFKTHAPEHLIQKIHEAITAIAVETPPGPINPEITSLRSVSEDSWLRQTEAATYLGISTNTVVLPSIDSRTCKFVAPTNGFPGRV